MGTASFLLVGTGDSDESLCSVNHGAGRVMSRTAARGKTRKNKIITPALISDERFKRSMEGIKLITGDKHRIKEDFGVEDIQEDLKHAEWLLSYAKQIMLNHSGILSQNNNTK